ncbi:DUF1801 domain-containing protein [Mariniplasma anaerobium]|uniref:YdhG-like domain-containing protein n=1 Tax=Mariniplasma anaerobium TaxID=2735436 RepID=A0A7U9XVW8_9MOLU|nr:DUF1801 domain-containing protein [Mariniplasma anaerobium]BCR36186.1 hypothetical protein MPAN_010790 [Mariniplasma anaerobium]
MQKQEQTLSQYIENLEENRVDDIKKLIDIAKDITKKEPFMWGSIIGFGKIQYTYASKRQGDTFEFGFASRKQAITLYLSWDVNQFKALKHLGTYKTGKGCLYIKKLSDVNLGVLKGLIKEAVDSLKHNPIITKIYE